MSAARKVNKMLFIYLRNIIIKSKALVYIYTLDANKICDNYFLEVLQTSIN